MDYKKNTFTKLKVVWKKMAKLIANSNPIFKIWILWIKIYTKGNTRIGMNNKIKTSHYQNLKMKNFTQI